MVKRGFTIVEVIITITIMAILLVLAVVGVNATQTTSRDNERKADVESIATYLESYYKNGVSDATSIPTITNLSTNPSIEVNTNNFNPIAVTLTRSSTWASSGTYSLRLAPNAADVMSYLYFDSCNGGMGILCHGMQAGKTYTLSARQYIPTTLSGSLWADRVARVAIWAYADGQYVFATGGGDTTAGTRTVSATLTIPANATEAYLRLYNGATNSAANYVYYDSIMLTEGPGIYNFADGSTPGWTWSGTANLSTSSGPAIFGNAGGTYPSISLASTDQISLYLRDADLKSFTAPGIDDAYTTFIPATNNTQTTSGVQPQPTKDQYVYQPIDSSGNLCTDGDCRKFNIYYRLEGDSTVYMVTSKNQ